VQKDHCSNDVPIPSRRVPRPMTKVWERRTATEMGEGHVGGLIRRPSGPFGFGRVDSHYPGCIVPKACPVRWDKIPQKALRHRVTIASTEGEGSTHTTHHGFVWTISVHTVMRKERKQGLHRGNFAPNGVQRWLLNGFASPCQAHTGLPVQKRYYGSDNFISAQRWVESRNHLGRGRVQVVYLDLEPPTTLRISRWRFSRFYSFLWPS
jgi:hypothetical protein